jgi:hypothetical protein
MDFEAEFAKAIAHLVEKRIREQAPYFTTGVFLQSEPIDSNLSMVQVAGSVARYIPKLSHVTLSPSDVVLMARAPGVPLVILGVIVGDITLAEV